MDIYLFENVKLSMRYVGKGFESSTGKTPDVVRNPDSVSGEGVAPEVGHRYGSVGASAQGSVGEGAEGRSLGAWGQGSVGEGAEGRSVGASAQGSVGEGAEGEPQPLASVIPEITTKSKLSGIQPVTSNPSIPPLAGLRAGRVG